MPDKNNKILQEISMTLPQAGSIVIGTSKPRLQRNMYDMQGCQIADFSDIAKYFGTNISYYIYFNIYCIVYPIYTCKGPTRLVRDGGLNERDDAESKNARVKRNVFNL